MALDYKNRNIYTYCVSSLILMMIMSFMINMGNIGTGINTQPYGTVYNGLTTSGQQFVGVNSTSYNTSDVGQLITTSNPNNVLDPTASAVNWQGALGKIIALTTTTLVTLPVLFILAYSVGGILGFVLGTIMLVWEMQIGYLIAVVILGARLK